MKIGIDARMYGPAVGGGGLGRYVQELVSHLQALAHPPTYTFFVKPENADACRVLLPHAQKRVVDVHWYTLGEQVVLPGFIDKEKLDLVHFPHWNVPLGLHTPFVVTVHDLILLEEPRSARATTLPAPLYALKRLGFLQVLRHALTASRKIIAVSQYTKQSILFHFPHIPPEKIVVIYEGVSDLPATDTALFIPQPYVLTVGNAYPHKNLALLLRAFRLVKAVHPHMRLVLAGRDDVFSRRLVHSAEAHVLGESFLFIPEPSDTDLAALYKYATASVFPSRIEGFGLPPLEAMKAGVPVASSNAGPMPEVLKDAALFFDPHQEEALARAVIRLIEDPALRADLIARGQKNVERFSWRAMAQATESVYEQAGHRKP